MKIQILMSTYNGEQYICTQLNSIVEQNVENYTLLIRDDGSTDNTVKIIKEYQKRYPWISYYQCRNVGVQRSFFELISKADASADYVAFSDQDDLWLPEKLQRAIECLSKMNGKMPLLYCSDKIIVDENLDLLDVTVSRIVRKVSFGNALVQNICTGCTAVVNQELVKLIKKHPPKKPDAIIMHDWWLYLTASCFGEVYYDKNAFIKYRQHGKNTSGAMLNKSQLLKYRLHQLMKPRGDIYKQVKEFYDVYQEYLGRDFVGNFSSMHYLELIHKLLNSEKSFLGRIKLILDRRIFRQKQCDDIIFRLITLLGKL